MPLNLNLNRTVRRLATATLRRIPSGPDRLMPALFDAQQITPELVLSTFRLGVIPLENGPGRIKWELPERRALMSIEQFHVPKNVARLVRNQRFEVTANEAFEETVAACAEIRGQRNSTTWIVPRLQRAFAQLHAMGAPHSIECRKDGELAGGLFGLAFGSYFITLSQFHRVRDASKVGTGAADSGAPGRGLHDPRRRLPEPSPGAVRLQRGVAPGTAETPDRLQRTPGIVRPGLRHRAIATITAGCAGLLIERRPGQAPTLCGSRIRIS